MDIDTKIEIKTENKRHYYDVALLVDKPDFIDWVLDLRKKWKINQLYSSGNYIGFYSHIMKVSGNRWNKFQEDIGNVRRQFGHLPNFDEVIMYAIGFTEIPDGVYKSCYAETIEDTTDPDDEDKYKYAIIVTPNTTEEDICLVLSEIKKKIKKGLEQKKDSKVMEKAVADYKFELGPNYTPPPRIIDNIIRDRYWYWQHKNGDSYQEIWKNTPKNMSNTSNRDGVIKAVKAYTKRLMEI